MNTYKLLNNQYSSIKQVYKSTLTQYHKGTNNQKKQARKRLKELDEKLQTFEKIKDEVLFDEYV